MPPHVHIPQLRPIFPLWRRRLVSRARILRQALLDQLHQGLAKALSVPVRLLQCRSRPLHGNQQRRSAGDAVGRRIDDIGVRHVRFDVDDRRAVEQVDAGYPQATGFDLVQLHHGLPDAIGPMGRTGGKYPHGLVAAEARRADFQAGLFFQGLMKQEQ
ncbi:hypothetical protein D3C86_1744610 [compost metagenome]